MARRDSDSDSERSSHRKKAKRSRRNSSSDSHGESDSSSTRKHRHYSSRHNSRSRSRSRESRRKDWKHSRSPKRRSRRSRSSSVSRHNSRSHSRSSSRSRTSRRTRRSRSRSGSRSFKSKSSKRHRRSVSRSRSKSPRSKSSSGKAVQLPPEKESDKLKRKVQQALKAAANADAELREKGLLGGETSTASTDFLNLASSTSSFTDQLRRVQTLEEINAPTFTQQQFLSSRSNTKNTQKPDDFLEKDAHSAAIFGLGAPKLGMTSLSSDASIKKLETWKDNPMMLVHHSLFGDEEGRQERWVKKLLAMRRKLVSGDVL